MGRLLDVNALIALLDPNHVHHEVMHIWFGARKAWTWATCPLTENGLVRVLAQPSYPGGPFAPRQTIGMLRSWIANQDKSYEWWADDVSLTDATLFRAEHVVAARQVTDVYLLGMAHRRGGRLVSLDRSLPWAAIHGATVRLIENPLISGASR